jgi:hypothetical protein
MGTIITRIQAGDSQERIVDLDDEDAENPNINPKNMVIHQNTTINMENSER